MDIILFLLMPLGAMSVLHNIIFGVITYRLSSKNNLNAGDRSKIYGTIIICFIASFVFLLHTRPWTGAIVVISSLAISEIYFRLKKKTLK